MGVRPINLKHYDLKTLAKNLKLASIDVIKTTNTDIESHWFRSIGPADLYYWKTKSKIIKHQISIYNQVIEWNIYEGVKTGFVNDELGQNEGEVILFDEVVNEKVIEQAIEFLNQVKCIEVFVLNDLISHYQFYNRWPIANPVKAMRSFFKKFSKKS
jgi:hypothetical protein